MKPLTSDAFAEYMRWAHDVEPSYGRDVAEAMRRGLEETNYMEYLTMLALKANIIGGFNTMLSSIWATAFQMGREFESRQMEKEELERLAKL